MTAPLTFARWLAIAIEMHVGNPRTNFDHCTSSRTECIEQYGRETYLWCLFWCRDPAHCRLGVDLAVAMKTPMKADEKEKLRKALTLPIRESLANGGCSALSRP